MLSDLRHACRQLARNPGFSVAVMVIVALAIGANTAEFSLTRAVLQKPLPWPQADRLVYVWNTAARIGWPLGPVAVPDYLDRRNQTDCFADSTLLSILACNVATGPTPEQVIGLRVTPSFFSTFGVAPWKGRVFSAAEAVPGGEKVAILTYELWQSKLGGREDSLGSELRMNGEIYRVIGIMPRSFLAPSAGLPSIGEPKIELLLPYAFTAEEQSDRERGNWSSVMIARLRPGVTIAQAQEQVDVVQQHRERKPTTAIARKTGGFGGVVVDYREQNTGRVRPMLLILQAAVTVILVIACANVGNLLLVRATARRRELSIRVALGCGRLGLARQLLTESVLLVLIGGAGGLAVGQGGLAVIRGLGSDRLPFAETIAIDPVVVGFAVLLSLGTSAGLGLVLLGVLWRQDPADALRDGNGRGSAGSSSASIRGMLIVAEVALALTLLIAAGLTIKSVRNLEQVQPGFASDGVLTAQLALPPAVYQDDAAIRTFYGGVLRAIRALPGVKSASAVSNVPFSGNYNTSNYALAGDSRAKGDPEKNGQIQSVDPDYFGALQIPVLRGRGFGAEDADAAKRVVVIDEFLAHRYFSGHDPIGQVLKVASDSAGGFKTWTIVGVVGEVKTASLADPVLKETLYFPLAQRPEAGMTLVIRTAGDPRALVAPVRAAIQQLDPELPAYDVQTMDQRLAASLAGYRSPMLLLGWFGAAALGLATFGLYAVLAYSVSQRTREIGIRLALGAPGRSILFLVIGQGLRLTLLGILLGLGISLALTRFLHSLLFGVSASDPLTYAAIALLLIAVALLACYLPARDAARVDPLVSLRTD